ncbi:MAG: hypothetical protein IPJ97_05750 [Proteobacteria bacterium]|nr:hypothetical protein [Pseudomonadota bacterium]
MLRNDTTLAAANAPITTPNPSTSHTTIGMLCRREVATFGFGVVIKGTLEFSVLARPWTELQGYCGPAIRTRESARPRP